MAVNTKNPSWMKYQILSQTKDICLPKNFTSKIIVKCEKFFKQLNKNIFLNIEDEYEAAPKSIDNEFSKFKVKLFERLAYELLNQSCDCFIKIEV